MKLRRMSSAVAASSVSAAAVPVDATPFDMRGVELGHHGGD